MGVEIERKFLVRGGAWRTQVERSEAIEQGYLAESEGHGAAFPGCCVRIRRAGPVAQINVKSREQGARRVEFEFPIDPAAASEMLEVFCRERIVKTRHHVRVAGRQWEIDEFGGSSSGLVIAEIELDAVEEDLSLPDWAGIELTHEMRFYNAALVDQPFNGWPDRDYWAGLMQAC